MDLLSNHIRDLDELSLAWWFGLRLDHTYDPATLKNVANFKSGQQWPQKSHLTSFTKIESNFMIHSMNYFVKTKFAVFGISL